MKLGQLGFVALVVLLERSFRVLKIAWPRLVERLPGYAVGTLGAYWTIQRTLVCWWERGDSTAFAGAGRARPRRPPLARPRLGPHGVGRADGFLADLHHPLSGIDHVLAMLS